ncbi:MAG: 50S ribosomal protein L9 [Chlamydiota bacterium]
MSKQSQVLLLEDIAKLGNKGAVVSVKPGYARNFLFPQGKAVIANEKAKRMQMRLQEERAKQAADDKEQAELIKSRVEGITISTIVKVDPIGHLYGSVKAADIVQLLDQEGITVDKHEVVLPKPIKSVGTHEISLNLKEGVVANFKMEVLPEGQEEPQEVQE